MIITFSACARRCITKTGYQFAFLLMGFLIALPVAVGDGSPYPNWLIERLEQSHDLTGIDYLRIENKYGDMRVRVSDDDTLSIYGVSQRHDEDPVLPKLVFKSEGLVASLVVAYPENPANSGASLEALQLRRRIDIAVFVPRDLKINAQTTNGLIQVKGHQGFVEATTQKGDISVHSHHAVSLKSHAGNISAILRNPIPPQPSSITTHTGRIHVLFMEDASVLTEITTAGAITSDYSIDITPFPGSHKKQAVAILGEGGANLHIASERGAITLARNSEMLQIKPADH
ncbi:MAG: hypothetical protein HOC23_18490 [Halieaceae bacterium]|nr:hypothetical protein [Halieaceae bacterium]